MAQKWHIRASLKQLNKCLKLLVKSFDHKRFPSVPASCWDADVVHPEQHFICRYSWRWFLLTACSAARHDCVSLHQLQASHERKEMLWCSKEQRVVRVKILSQVHVQTHFRCLCLTLDCISFSSSHLEETKQKNGSYWPIFIIPSS